MSIQKKRKFFLIAIPFILIAIATAYYQFLYKPYLVDNGMAKPDKIFTGYTSEVWVARFSPNGKLIASGSADNKWLLSGGRDKPVIGELLQIFFGDSKVNRGVSIHLWDLNKGIIIQTFSEHTNDANDVAFSRDEKWILSAGSGKTVELWRLLH
ncbi:MAG: hypothetical protein ABI741_02970 [Ferruginibacter sp.]